LNRHLCAVHAHANTDDSFIKEQLSLEAEAREALPYVSTQHITYAHLSNSVQQFDTCTRDLGPLRQGLYSCLDCNPPPADSSEPYIPAAVCYACSISCHGEHSLVELFNKRNFVCDCGTTRLPESTPCTLRVNSTTGQKGDVVGEEPAVGNKYNQNFRNKFCGCGEKYDPDEERGTMFQCLGLGTLEDGGCGEDWWHPECVMGLSREEFQQSIKKPEAESKDDASKNSGIMREVSFSRTEEEATAHPEGRRPSIVTAIAAGLANDNGLDGNDLTAGAEEEDEDVPLPPGFPAEDDFEYFLCYKCVEANPWIKRYAGNTGFLPPVYCDASINAAQIKEMKSDTAASSNNDSKKRKADDDQVMSTPEVMAPPKRQKSEDPVTTLSAIPEDTTASAVMDHRPTCKLPSLTPLPVAATAKPFSLFLSSDFHNHLCHCATCFPLLKPHPQLLEEEDIYEPPISEDGNNAEDSVGTGSLLDRGEAALNNMDRVRAIQGAMAYASLKEGLKGFLKPFAESGQMVGAEDIKAYFEKLRGDETGIQAAAGDAKKNEENDDGNGDGTDNDGRREQSGY
jgi:E3 ubiquitin-protein ligase UBR7